jgi:hypothetical protein
MNLDMADVKPSVLSFLLVTVMAIVGIALAKFLLNKWPVKGLTPLVNSV